MKTQVGAQPPGRHPR